MVDTHDQESCAGELCRFDDLGSHFSLIKSATNSFLTVPIHCADSVRPPRKSDHVKSTIKNDPISDDFSRSKNRIEKLFGQRSEKAVQTEQLPRSSPVRSRRMGIISRGKSYYVRLNVPKSLQAIVGKTEFRRSLKTGRMAEAVRKARIVSTEFEQWLLEAEGKPIEGIAPAALATPSSFKPKTTGKTLRELCEVFLNDPTKNRSGKAISGYGNAVELAEAVLGREKVLGAIERQHCRDIIEVLKWVPSNSKKRFPTLDYMQAAEKSKAEALPLLSPKTVNDYIIKLSSLMNFAIDEGYVDRNPFRGLKVADDVHPRDKRNPFTNKQLRQIFDAPLYRGCVNDQGGYDQSGPNYPRRGRFWIPLIALYSGMRLNEICQLDLADVKTVGGVECFSVTTESARGGKDKKVKTMSSRRLVPIHTKLIEIGFLNYVADRRRQASIKLFPELPISATGYFSDPFSKWFVRFLIKCGAARDKTSFHSFRHCFRDAMRNAKLDHEIGLALGGWTSASGKDAEVASIRNNCQCLFHQLD